MSKKKSNKLIWLLALLPLIFVGTIIWYLNTHDIAVFNTQGEIGHKERNLMATAGWLSLAVIVPVYLMTILIAWRYREGNHKAKHTPEWDGNTKLELVWWGIPFTIILILSVITWNSSHTLDPFKPLQSNNKPLTIQVIALQWKWLFIYPDYNVASLNYVVFPEKTPIKFEITSDAPMNSFWIPKLGGQIYAMSGMSTHLNLIADGKGQYQGSSANISGKGFANMHFMAESCSQTNFMSWIQATQQSPNLLTAPKYQELAKPSEDTEKTVYSLGQDQLYNTVIQKYLTPQGSSQVMKGMGH